MSIQQTWMYFLLTLLVAFPVSAAEPPADYPSTRSILRRGPVVQLPRGDVDIVTSALAGADRKHDSLASVKTTGSRWSGRPSTENPDAKPPLVELPGMENPGPAASSNPNADTKPATPSLLERWRARRAEAKAKAATKAKSKTEARTARNTANGTDGPPLVPPEVEIGGK